VWIRSKILLACLSLTAVTVALGLYGHSMQRDLGRLGICIFDDTALSISYLRSAQNTLVSAEARWLRRPREAGTDLMAPIPAVIPDVLEDLDVARARAMSPAGRVAVQRVRDHLARIADALHGPKPAELMEDIERIEAEFAIAVEVYAADGYEYRRKVGALVDASAHRTLLAIGVSVLIAVAITALLTRSIVPALHKALGIAQAIASGRLDTVIGTARGVDETSHLLRAIEVMQTSIRGLMDQQQRSYIGQIAAEHAKLGAALDNMSQGLCLFDSQGRLDVANQRFSEMFAAPLPGTSPEQVLQGEMLAPLLGREAEAAFSCTLADGRVIAVCNRPVTGGGWVTTYEDVTQRHEAALKLTYMARHDTLTGLPNRMALGEHMPRALTNARRYGGLAVLCLDLDRFKAVNDGLGHAAGDVLLCAVAQRLRDCTRAPDLVVRLGGDEFAIIQEHAAEPADAPALADRVIEALSVPFEIGQQQVLIGVSIGIAQYSGELDTSEALLKSADLALYRAKATDKSSYRIFEPEMDVEAQLRRELELDLRCALPLDQFEVFYQPLMAASTASIGGFEALLRWRHPVKGLVSPAIFIPLAEEISLIEAIGTWVLGQACIEAMSWPGALRVAVNLSPSQFRSGLLLAQVEGALARSGLPADRLELEITESVLLQDEDTVIETLQQLRALGVRIAMDDFGTGYSSLSYLRRFPFDKIKIDQSFVQGLGEHEDSDAIVRAIVGLGRSLGMTVNAEGVETTGQLAALRAEGCGELQGFLFSPPRPADEVLALLHQHGNASLPLCSAA
jgi:diguanylate cyclase (GGDEF)-like protein